MRSRVVASLLAVLGGLAVATASAGASDPGRWKLSSVDRLAPLYRGGLSADGAGHVFWSGAGEGLFRSSTSLAEQLRLGAAIPPALRTEPGFALVGDPGWDASGSGRLVVPFRCAVGASSATCPQAGLGIYDRGLLWGQFVRLDRSAATSIDWAEPSPDGLLVWTSSGRDLLAFSAADVRPGNGVPLMPVARFAGVVPLSRVTGATFMGGRLWLAGDGAGRIQAWSLDVAADHASDARLELDREITGRPGGVGVFDGRGGTLHWVVAPTGRAPTFRGPLPSLLSFVPAEEAALEATFAQATLRAGRPASIVVRVAHRFAGRTRPVAGARVSAGRRSALTGEDGEAELRVRPLKPGTLNVEVAKRELTPVTKQLPVVASIGGSLSGPPRVRLSGGAGERLQRAARLLDCSGSGGCEALDPPRARGCLPLRGGADLRIGLFRRPPRQVSVLLQGGGRTYAVGRAAPSGLDGLGWRLRLSRGVPRRGRLDIVLIYPDGTGAQLVTRTRAGRC